MRAIKQLGGYFEAEMRIGRVRRQDPEVVARAFLGFLNAFVFFQLLLHAHGELPMGDETYVRGLVSLLWGASSRGRRRPGTRLPRRGGNVAFPCLFIE